MDLQWWILAVELPVLGGLFLLFQHHRNAVEQQLTALRHEFDAYKLTVATTYASLTHLRQTEERLTGHLLRIDEKLDRVVEGRIGARDDG